MVKTSNESNFKDKLYKIYYENSLDMYRTIDQNGIIIACNKTYANNLGYSMNEVIGTSLFAHISEESFEAMTKTFEIWKKTGTVKNREIIMKRKDNSTFPALISASNLYDEHGKMIGSNTIVHDITAIVDAEREIEYYKVKKFEAIGELAARIAHDLNNPLSIIKNSLVLMKKNNTIENDKNYVRINRAIMRISHQIDEVLDYVKPKPLNMSEHNLSDIVHTTLERIEKPKGVIINLSGMDVKLVCDAEKLEIVFVNLVLNAMQAMSNSGTIDIQVSDSNDVVKIKMTDSGPGIPHDLLSKVFDPLFTTREIGTGLGLPSCKAIIEKHGGSISVSSILGKSATFEINIPK